MRLLITIDVEAHRTLDEIGGDDGSLAKILTLLNVHNIKATFFVDTCEVATWGGECIKEICDRINRGGHELALHAHPHHFTKDNTRWLLHEYSREEQESILAFAIDEYVKAVGKQPEIFRAGGFGANDVTLNILRRKGVIYDSSYLLGHKNCDINPPLNYEEHTIFNIDGTTEIPLTPVVTLSLFGKEIRTSALDFNWLPLFFIMRVLSSLERSGASTVILLMHSSSLTKRVSPTEFEMRGSLFKKFDKLLMQVKNRYSPCAMGVIAQTQGVSSIPFSYRYVEKNPVIQFAILFYQAAVGRGHSRLMATFFWAVIIVPCAVILIMILNFSNITK